MEELKFNTKAGEAVTRKLLVLYLNTSDDGAPKWAPIGKRVEDSSMEYDWGEESKTDILGNTYSTLKPPTITQTFDPCELDADDSAQVKIWNMAIKDQDVGAMANNDLLIVHTYAGDAESGAFAERYPSSMVKPSSLGGSSSVGMPIDVTFGGARAIGTAAVSAGTVTFAEKE